MKLSLVIPCYDESGNIPLILDRLKSIASKYDFVEFILVNNGSRDNSSDVFATELSQLNPQIYKLVNIPVNQGYGYGILQGLETANGDILAWTHADMQTDPADVIKAYNLIQAHPDQKILAKGKRRNRQLLERLFTFGMQIVAYLALHKYMDDINAQPKAFTRSFYNAHVKQGAPNDFSLDLYLLYQAKTNGYKIYDFPVVFADRIHGDAKGGGGSWKNRIKLVRRTWNYIFELKERI